MNGLSLGSSFLVILDHSGLGLADRLLGFFGRIGGLIICDFRVMMACKNIKSFAFMILTLSFLTSRIFKSSTLNPCSKLYHSLFLSKIDCSYKSLIAFEIL